MVKQLFLFSLLIVLTFEVNAQMHFTTNDISSTPNPKAGFLPDPEITQTPISKLPERSVDIARRSLDNAHDQNTENPIDVFSQKVDPLAEYKPQRFDPEESNFGKYENTNYVRDIGFNPNLSSKQQEEKYKIYKDGKNLEAIRQIKVVLLLLFIGGVLAYLKLQGKPL